MKSHKGLFIFIVHLAPFYCVETNTIKLQKKFWFFFSRIDLIFSFLLQLFESRRNNSRWIRYRRGPSNRRMGIRRTGRKNLFHQICGGRERIPTNRRSSGNSFRDVTSFMNAPLQACFNCCQEIGNKSSQTFAKLTPPKKKPALSLFKNILNRFWQSNEQTVFVFLFVYFTPDTFDMFLGSFITNHNQ